MSNLAKCPDMGNDTEKPWWAFTDDEVYERDCPGCFGDGLDSDGELCVMCRGEGYV